VFDGRADNVALGNGDGVWGRQAAAQGSECLLTGDTVSRVNDDTGQCALGDLGRRP
jgi:hypothetical protein